MKIRLTTYVMLPDGVGDYDDAVQFLKYALCGGGCFTHNPFYLYNEENEAYQITNVEAEEL